MDIHQEVFGSHRADEVLPVVSPCPGSEWDGYDPDTDSYDVRTLPHEPSEITYLEEQLVQLQMAALERRIQYSGEPAVLDHYRSVLQEMKQLTCCSLSKQVMTNVETKGDAGRWFVPRLSGFGRKDSCASQLLSTTDGSSCSEDSEDSDTEVTLSDELLRESACWSMQLVPSMLANRYQLVRSDSCDSIASEDSITLVWM